MIKENMIKEIVILSLLFTVLLSSGTALIINELYYNPPGTDNEKEFVEILGTNNISEYTIADNSSSDTLLLLRYANESNLSLVVEVGFNYTDLDCSIFSAGTTIGNGLGNTGDTIYLIHNNTQIANLTYFDPEQKHSSIEKTLNTDSTYQYFSDDGTPCRIRNISIIDNLSNEVPLNITQENSTVTTNNNTQTDTTDTINSTQTNQSVCHSSIGFVFEKKIYEAGEQIHFFNTLTGNDTSEDYEIHYWIEDIWGNIIKKELTTKNTNQKSFTPKINQSEKVLVFKNALKDTCLYGTKETTEYIIIRNTEDHENQQNLKILEFEEFTADISDINIKEHTLSTTVTFINTDSSSHTYRIQTYLMKNTKKYDIIDFEEIAVDSYAAKTQTMDITLNLTEGTYEQKIIMYKDDTKKKTLTRKVTILNTETTKSEKNSKNETNENTRTKKQYIQSFYTLAKNYDKEIRIFANVENTSGMTINIAKLLYVYDIDELQEQFNGTKIVFSTNLTPGDNTFFILAVSNSSIIDYKTLNLYKNQTNQYNQSLSAQKTTIQLNNSDQALTDLESVNHKNQIISNADITGQTIYLSKSLRAIKFLNYAWILVPITALSILIWWIHEKRKNNHKTRIERKAKQWMDSGKGDL